MNHNDFEEVFSFEHLLSSANLCKRGVNWKASVQNFMYEMEYNVNSLHNELMSGNFKIKHRYEFDIFERGKKRHIQSVHIRERVVQRCLCDYCLTPLLEPTFCYDNCASQKARALTSLSDESSATCKNIIESMAIKDMYCYLITQIISGV